VTVPGFIEHGTVERAPTIPGLYRARYRRVLRPGVYHRSPPRGDTTPSHRLTLAPRPPSYATIPGPETIPRGDPVDTFPVLRGDPRPLHARPPGRRHRLTTHVLRPQSIPSSPSYKATPGRLPRLTVPVLRGDPRPPAAVLRSSSARRLPRLTRRSPGRPAVLRPPSYDPRLPRDRRRRDPAFLAA